MLYRLLSLVVVCSFATALMAQPLQQPAPAANNEIAFASDTQAPMFIETLWLKPNHNRVATKRIFADIEKRRPSSLFLLGDVVNLGYSNKQWKPMDVNLAALRNEGIKVDAALGNHEVMGESRKGQRKFQKRFPDHVKTGYVQVVDSVAVILLNSNFNTLNPEENQKQLNWYRQELNRLDSDSSVQFIICCCHHSPYTNSKIVGCSSDVQQKFVPPFLASTKSRLFLSGHSHNFEHYKVSGKDFLVIGGGGGLHQPLNEGKGSLPDEQLTYKPMFHYLTVRRSSGQLQVTSHELNNNFKSFDEGLTFNVQPGYKKPQQDIASTHVQEVK
ncbi:MAG: metallophosphoesterase family protein [Candidatus Dadabacteria bacterium]